MNNNSSEIRLQQKQALTAGPGLQPAIIAIASGLQGVGKSTLAANIAVALARSSSRVCLLDAGTGSVNACSLLGIDSDFALDKLPQAGQPLLTGHSSKSAHPWLKMIPAGREGVRVLPSASKVTRYLRSAREGQVNVADVFEVIENNSDYLILDLNSDGSAATLHLALAAQVILIVITTEPKSLSHSFLLLRELQRRTRSRLSIQVVLNLAENARSAAGIYQRFSETVAKYLHLQTELLGSVWVDRQLSHLPPGCTLAAQMPITEPVCRTFFRLARRLTEITEQKRVQGPGFSTYWRALAKRVAQASAGGSSAPVKSALSTTLVGHGTSADKAEAVATSRKVKQRNTEQLAMGAERSKAHAGRSEEDNQKRIKEARVWLKFRAQLCHFLQHSSDRSDHIDDLLAVCLEFKGKTTAAPGFTESVLALLAELSPDQLNAEQRLRLGALAKGLMGEFYQSVLQSVAQASDHRPEYDEKGFGDQWELLQKLRQASPQQSLNSLLDALKYATKVDTFDS